ncbi:hypothetical protein WNY37_17010 [Henriciella sp. AS95]|uniref:hypothetical protein n=1 Tax=Henriciella sp. AS95 TaxID=3135782 RepID=UPI00317E1A8F
MFSRAWILDTLSRLELRYWPIFFWEMLWVERYYRAYRAANPVGILAVGVTAKGRLHIKLQAAGDAPDPNDWTAHAPRAPWLALAPGAGLPAPLAVHSAHILLAERATGPASVAAGHAAFHLEPG